MNIYRRLVNSVIIQNIPKDSSAALADCMQTLQCQTLQCGTYMLAELLFSASQRSLLQTRMSVTHEKTPRVSTEPSPTRTLGAVEVAEESDSAESTDEEEEQELLSQEFEEYVGEACQSSYG